MSDTSSVVGGVRRPLRVLFSTGSLGGGGAERRLVELLHHLDRTRIAPSLYVMEREGPLVSDVPDDVPLAAWRDPSRRQPLARRVLGYAWPEHARAWGLWQHLRQHPADLVVGWLLQSAYEAVRPCRWAGLPLIASAVSVPELEIPSAFPHCSPKKGHQRSQRTYHVATCVLTHSEDLKARTIAAYQLPPDRVLSIPSLRDFSVLDRQVMEIPPAWPTAGHRLLAVGRLDRNKGHHDLLQALARLQADMPSSASLLIVGDGPERAHLQQQITRLGLDHVVRLTGHVSMAAPYLRAADVVLLTSYHEGLPNVLLEALALGTPVISTDCPTGPREILEGGRWGRLTPVGDIDAMARAICETLSDLPQARAAAQTAAVVVREKHDIRTGVRGLEDLLLQAADRFALR